MVTSSISESVSSGGVEVVVRNLHDLNIESSIESRILSLYPKGDKPKDLISDQHYLFEAKKFIKDKSWSSFSIKALVALVSIIKQFEVVHIHLSKDFFTPTVLIISQILRKRVVIQTHGMIRRNGKIGNALGNFIIRCIVGSQTIILYLTDPEKSELLNIGLRGSLHQINNPVNNWKLAELNKSRNQTVLFLSRFHPRKRPLEFVLAAKLILEKYPSARFIMAGPDDGSQRETLEKISELNLETYFEFPGSISRENIPRIFDESRVFILPSYGEVFPVSVLEAAVAGVPIVLGRDCPLGNEISKSGGLLHADSAIEIYDAVDTIFSDQNLEKTLVLNASNWIDENCSRRAVAKKLYSVYSIKFD